MDTIGAGNNNYTQFPMKGKAYTVGDYAVFRYRVYAISYERDGRRADDADARRTCMVDLAAIRP